MKKKLIKQVWAAVVLMVVMLSAFSMVAFAQPELGLNFVDQTGLQTTNSDPRAVAVQVVTYLLTFLGIIAVVVILLGGFRWMTAGGNEDNVASAKKTVIAGMIGLVIVLSAYVIVNFVVGMTTNAITGQF